MYEFLKLQYAMGRVTIAYLRKKVPRWITEEQLVKILEQDEQLQEKA